MSDIIQKPEKIASAIYLVTSFFNDQEPVKWKLRNLASELVSFSLAIKDSLSKEREVSMLKGRKLLLEIMSFLTVAKNVGLVSDTNFDLLNQEVMKYIGMLGLPSGVSEENGQIALEPGYFHVKEERVDRIMIAPRKSEVVIKDKNIEEAVEEEVHQMLPPVSSFVSKRHEPVDKPANLKEFGAVSVKKNSRQSVIIGILKRKKEIMIKDVSPLISGCSEKTIQRELMTMVQSGILKKMGEKRWSRYSLA